MKKHGRFDKDGRPEKPILEGTFIRGITIKLRNGEKSQEFIGQYKNGDKILRVENLGEIDIASVAFLVKHRNTGTTQ